jgi:DNA repair protein RadB
MLDTLLHTLKPKREYEAEPVMSTRLPTGCAPLDELLHGGVESGALTEFFGEAGSGKTNVCLQLARNMALAGKKTIFIDTEGVSMERLQQIAGDAFSRVRESILFFEPYSLREQEAVIEKTVRLASGAPDVGLVIVDSATLHYRIALGTGDDVGGRRALGAQLHMLIGLARKRDIPVVITNQVTTNLETDELEPLGGSIVRHLSKAVVRLDKTAIGRRRATVLKHRAVQEGISAEFRIATRGLVGLDEPPAPTAAVAEPDPAFRAASE